MIINNLHLDGWDAKVSDSGIEKQKENKLLETILMHNEAPVIFNDKYLNTEELPDDLIVLLVQVHNRIVNLKALIESLKDVEGINKTLLIFSHDHYDDDLNNLVKSIDFCAYTQIFYPYMLQLYDDRFPGRDKKDCDENMTKLDALKVNCTNALNPDTYGHFRNYKIVQIKNHWFWKISFVFDWYLLTKSLSKLSVILLEDDFFLYPDTLYIMNELNKVITNSLGNSINETIVELGASQLSLFKITSGNSALYSVCTDYVGTFAMQMKRSVWDKLKVHYKEFCEYDDYNWDW